VIAQEQAPLCGRGALPCLFQGPRQRARIVRGQCAEQPLVHVEVEHHVHAVAVATEVLHVRFRQHVRRREDVEAGETSSDFAIREIDDLDGVVAECRHEQALPRDVDRHVIDASSDLTE
jgi:hypothetical protein